MKAEARKTRSYSVFYEEATEGGYVAFVPALPDRHTQGETLEEAEQNVTEAITLYLESLINGSWGSNTRIPRPGDCAGFRTCLSYGETSFADGTNSSGSTTSALQPQSPRGHYLD